MQIEFEQPLLFVGERAGYAFQNEMRRFLHRRQRRFQLVRYVRDEVFLHLVDLDEPLHHLPVLLPQARETNAEVNDDGHGHQK